MLDKLDEIEHRYIDMLNQLKIIHDAIEGALEEVRDIKLAVDRSRPATVAAAAASKLPINQMDNLPAQPHPKKMVS